MIMADKKEKNESSKPANAEKKAPPVKKEPKKGLISKLKREKPPAGTEQKDAKPVDDPFDVIRFVLMTEKSIRMVEGQNKLVFIVNRFSKRPQIKSAVENAFNSPVSGIKVLIDQDGRKKAFVKFKNSGAAGDIAIKLGII